MWLMPGPDNKILCKADDSGDRKPARGVHGTEIIPSSSGNGGGLGVRQHENGGLDVTSYTRHILGAILAGAMTLSAAHAADTISGAGATFPYPIYAKWAEAYKAQTGIAMNYQSIGSGGGIKQIQSKTVDFGASDMPLKPEQLEKSGLMQFPAIMGGIVPVVNVKGIQPGQLKLDGATLAKIYLGEIAKWNDAALKNLNPGLDLPNQAIAPVYRSDGSGTTFLFTDYLSKVSPDWKMKVGSSTSVKFPSGLGGKGNEGVAALSARTDGAIGYVEYAYAKQNKMSHVQLKNAAGKFVQPESAAFQAAAANADWAKAPGFGEVLTNEPGEKSWPITGATFILLYKTAQNPEKTKAVLDFFNWSFQNGVKMADELDYVPMPAATVKLIHEAWSGIKGANGQQLWTGKSS
jgi:phosphate transport system substrate-binding protein